MAKKGDHVFGVSTRFAGWVFKLKSTTRSCDCISKINEYIVPTTTIVQTKAQLRQIDFCFAQLFVF